MFEKFNSFYKGDIKGKTVTIWGLAFKPKTDDMREAPSLVLIEKLIEAGVKIKVYDPIAMEETERRIGNVVTYAKDMYDAAIDSDAIFLVTEWNEFRLPSWPAVSKLMNTQLIIDGRNIYNGKDLKRLNFEYYCIGAK